MSLQLDWDSRTQVFEKHELRMQSPLGSSNFSSNMPWQIFFTIVTFTQVIFFFFFWDVNKSWIKQFCTLIFLTTLRFQFWDFNLSRFNIILKIPTGWQLAAEAWDPHNLAIAHDYATLPDAFSGALLTASQQSPLF